MIWVAHKKNKGTYFIYLRVAQYEYWHVRRHDNG